jgi:phenylalanyl-tRNA synthetase alpha chain
MRDLTDPTAGPHAVQLVVDLLVDALEAAWNIPVLMYRGDPVVTIEDHYDLLRYPADAVTRNRRYSRYVDADRMLRAHTTAHIPALLRGLREPEILLAVPGMCYRRDVIDRHHVAEPHHLDLWRVRRAGPPLGEHDLTGMIGVVVGALLPGRPVTTPASPHPYTVDGREIYADGIEIGECGIAHPEVLTTAGLPASASGLAMGLGLDRLTMLAKGVDDIRLLRSRDPRVAGQMTDLAPYRPVSSMPPVRRDLSVAVAADTDAEVLGDRVRGALGPDAESVEEVAVLSETAYVDLPEPARDRLGIREGQKNVLVRLVIRHPDRTLTTAEANAIRDRVYGTLHAGTVKLLTGKNSG